MFNQS